MSLPAQQTAPPVPSEEPDSKGSRAAFILALVIGFMGIAVLAFVSHWAAIKVYGGGSQLVVSAVSPAAFFLVLLLIGAVNPLLRKFWPRLAMRRAALLMVLAMWLLGGVVCCEYLAGFAFYAAGNAENPVVQGAVSKRVHLESWLNPQHFLSREDAEKYYYGLSDGEARIGLRQIPWRAWLKPMLFWVPFLLVAVVFSSTLAQIFHRQWSKHELLTYPIANFTDALLEPPAGRALPPVFYDKLFWAGFGLIAFIYLVNGLHAWFPRMIEIPLGYSEIDLVREFPFLSRYCGREGYSLFRGTALPLVVALGVFLPADISFTCWFGWLLMVILPGVYFLFSGQAVGASDIGSMQMGMYAALLAAILIIGRREYWSILRHAATFRRTPDVRANEKSYCLRAPEDAALRAAAWACRWFVLAFIALVGLLMIAGLDLLPAFVLTCGFGLMVILIARITAEVGIPWLTNFGGAARAAPLKLLGSAAMGPKGLAVMAVVGAVLDYTTASNSVAAQETTVRKMQEKTGGTPRWLFNLVLLLAAGAAIGAAFVANLWDNYSYGAQKETVLRTSLSSGMQKAAVDVNLLMIEGRAGDVRANEKPSSLRAPGEPKASGASPATGSPAGIPAWKDQAARLGLIQPEQKLWRFVIFGAAVIGLCAFMRLRFTWWPLHPVPFLFIGSWALSRLYFSFFIAWTLKTVLLRIGGGKVFARSKPFFIGVIVGLIVVVMFWQIVGILYNLATGGFPPRDVAPFI